MRALMLLNVEFCILPEGYLISYYANYDVLTLIGTKLREQKSSTINTFINGLVGVDCNTNILCDTKDSASLVIDCSDARVARTVDLPPSISGMSQ